MKQRSDTLTLPPAEPAADSRPYSAGIPGATKAGMAQR